MRLRCRLEIGCSTAYYVNSASCFFPTSRQLFARRCASCGLEAASSSVSGGCERAASGRLRLMSLASFYPAIPHRWSHPPTTISPSVRTELLAAGFARIAVEEITKLVRASSAREAAVSICHSGLVRAAIEAQMPNRLDEITEAATTAITARFGAGPIESPLNALLFTAMRLGAL